MRRLALALLLILTGPSVLRPAAIVAQEQARLHFGIFFDRYYDGLYTRGAAGEARHVYFPNDPIDVVVEFANAGEMTQSIDVEAPVNQAFPITLLQGAGSGTSRLVLSPNGQLVSDDARVAVQWGGSIDIGPRSRAVWRGQFQGPTRPGVYKVCRPRGCSILVFLEPPQSGVALRTARASRFS